MKHLILRSDGIWWDMMGYRFRISLVSSCNVCRDVSRKRWPCREQTRDQLLRAQHCAASFSSSAAWFTSAAKWTDTKLTGELQVFSLKSSPETCLGRRSHAKDPPLHEACLPSLSTRNVTDIDMDINGPPGRVSTNASEHAMLHNMFFAPPSQNKKSVWCMLKHLKNHHGHALQCAGCVAWPGDAYHVIMSMSKWVDSFLTCSSCNLFFSFCKRVQSCLNLKAPNHWQVNYCHIAPVTCQAAATTVSVVPGMTFSSASIFSSSLGRYGKLLLDEPSSCSRICDPDSRDLYFVCCCTGMNIRTINYMHVYYLILFARCNTWEYQNISFHFHKLF